MTEGEVTIYDVLLDAVIVALHGHPIDIDEAAEEVVDAILEIGYMAYVFPAESAPDGYGYLVPCNLVEHDNVKPRWHVYVINVVEPA